MAQIKKYFTTFELPDGSRAGSATLRPRFMFIGAQKGGTTALYKFVSNHPQVAPPLQKEIDFFQCPALYARGLDFYHAHFPSAASEGASTVTFEASANYLVSALAAERIQAYDPRMKLVAVLRDPVTRAFSAWQMYRRFSERDPDWYFDVVRWCHGEAECQRCTRRRAFGESFEKDIREEMVARERGHRLEMPILRHGFYAEHLTAYLKHFPREQLFIEDSERLRTSPQPVLEELAAFLGLSPVVWQSSFLEPVFVGDYERTVPDGAAALLKTLYHDHNHQLYSLLGRDFDWI